MKPQKIYYWFTAFQAVTMFCFAATYVPFLLEIGLTLSQISLVNVGFWITIILMEVPTGMLADGNSRSWAIRIALILQVLGFLCMALADNFWYILASEIVIGLSFTFLSGIDKAWITDALHRYNCEEKPISVFAKATAIRGILAIPSAIIGALLGSYSLRAVWYLSIALAIANLVFVIRQMNGQGEPIQRVSEKEALMRSIRCLVTSPALIWAVAATMVIGFCTPFNHYWIPYFKADIPQAWLGIAFAVIYAPGVIGACLIQRLKIKRSQEGAIVLLSLAATGLGLGILNFTPGIALPLCFIAIHEIGRGSFAPVMDSFIQHRIKSEFRATFGSINSLLSRLGNGGILVATSVYMYGKADSKTDICEVFLIAGGLIIAGAIVLRIFKPRG